MATRTAISTRYTTIRVVQLLLALAVLLAGVVIVMGTFYASIFWPIALGLILPTLFAEPYFTGPRTALATAVAQMGAFFSSDRSAAPALWNLLLIVSVAVALSSIIAMLAKQRSGQFFHWVSTRFGRAIVLGSIVSIILILQVASESMSDARGLSVVLLIVYAVLFMDWAKLTLIPSSLQPKSGMVTAVFGPNQLLVRSFGLHAVGDRVKVQGPGGSANGYVAEDLASETGSQYRVVLDEHWRSVTDGSDSACVLTPLDDQASKPRGFAIEGSTDHALRVDPTSDMKIGETFELRTDGHPLLYQVAGLNLEEETWSGSSAIVARARMIQVGAVEPSGMIAAKPCLPAPYQPVYSATESAAELDGRYMRIGKLKGTNVPVGIRTDWMANHGHLAVLGMSGMGKTTVAAKLSNLAAGDEEFVILDETSEYRTRLAHAVVPIGELDWNGTGVKVCEPGGELPQQCERVIKSAMTAAQAEYASGETPRRRYLLLEEAHGWLPEWNFTSRDNADAVNRSCRYILQARKFNLTFVMVSQRTAVISKSAISQCENYIILRTLDQTSLEYVEGVIGQELKGLVSELGRYEAVCVGPMFNSDAPVIVTLDPAE